MAVEVERLIVALEARLDQYDRNLLAAQRVTDTRANAIERRFQLMSRNLKGSASTAAAGVGRAMAGIGAYLGVRQLAEYADGWKSVTRAVEANEKIFGMRLRSASELNKLATESRADLDALSKLYLRTAAATRDLGVSENDVAVATTTVAKALKLGSASAGEQASTMLQLSQAFQKGKLDGDEFRTVMENAGVVQQLLAERLKVSKGEIIRMAAAGKLSVNELFKALVEGADKVDKIFATMPTTIGEAATVLRNAMTEYVGKLDQSTGASEAFIAALTGVAGNMENVGDAALVAGAALLGMAAPAVVGRVLMLNAALAANPLGLLIASIAGAAAAYTFLADNIAYSTDGMTTLRDQIDATVSVLGDRLQPVIDEVSAVWVDSIKLISDALAGLPVSLEDVKTATANAMNATVGAMSFAVEAIKALFANLPAAIAQTFVDMANRVMQTVAQLVNGVAGLLNNLPGVEIGPVKFGEFENSFAGARTKLSDAMKTAGKELSRDFVGEFSAGNAQLQKEIEATAIAIANGRRLAASTTVSRPTESVAIYKDTGAGSGGGKRKRENAFEKGMRETRERIAAIQLENATMGESEQKILQLKTAQELLNAAKQAGVAITPELAGQIAKLSEAYAQAKTQADAMKAGMDELRSISSDVLKGFINDLREGKSGMEALQGALDKIADKLIDMAVQQLILNAFGGAGTSGGGILGSLFANGGVAAHGKPVPLPKFAGGGVSRTAAIFGEAGPEAAVPLPDGRRIPVDLRLPEGKAAGGGRAGGEIIVTVNPSDKLYADIDNRAEGAVARNAPSIIGASVQAVDKNFGGMVGKYNKRSR